MVHSLSQPPLFTALTGAKKILVAGAGGGFDVFSGIPLYFALKAQGKEVYMANLSFTALPFTKKTKQITSTCREVTPDSEGGAYFPELYLSKWFKLYNENVPLYAFERHGVVQLKENYQALIERLGLDAIVLVDGGTDSLMRGDEAGLGTPVEDAASLAAIHGLALEHKYLVCLGFGVDYFHGVCHAQFLENVAAISKENGYLGCFSMTPTMSEAIAFRSAVEYLNRTMPTFNSIVTNSVASALAGHYGDHHTTDRTEGSQLWINPLMSIFWCFKAETVSKRLLYLNRIIDTKTYDQIAREISSFRENIDPKKWERIPV